MIDVQYDRLSLDNELIPPSVFAIEGTTESLMPLFSLKYSSSNGTLEVRTVSKKIRHTSGLMFRLHSRFSFLNLILFLRVFFNMPWLYHQGIGP